MGRRPRRCVAFWSRVRRSFRSDALQSIPRDKETARFSILAYNPVFEIQFENGVLYQNGQVIDRDPLDFLYEVTHKSQHHSDLPFGGGAIGFVGYDMISLYEEIGQIIYLFRCCLHCLCFRALRIRVCPALRRIRR